MQNTNICYQTLKILILASACIANREICIADTNICLKDTNYMWQIQRTNFYILKIYKWPSKFGAPGCAPAGFFPAKINVLYFINRESLFLCLRYIKHVLSDTPEEVWDTWVICSTGGCTGKCDGSPPPGEDIRRGKEGQRDPTRLLTPKGVGGYSCIELYCTIHPASADRSEGILC